MEYQAGRGTTALGIIGTILGSVGTAGALGVGANWLTGGSTMGNSNNTTLALMEELSNKNREIAQLTAEKYSDNSDLALYKYFDGKLEEMRDKYETRFAEQAVINANVTGSISALSQQVRESANLLNDITQTAVPSSKICNFGCGCGN